MSPPDNIAKRLRAPSAGQVVYDPMNANENGTDIARFVAHDPSFKLCESTKTRCAHTLCSLKDEVPPPSRQETSM
jgi:hypothetical protein